MNYMAYAIIGGVMLVSILAMFMVGVDDGWVVPVVVLPLGAIYLLFDQRMRKRGL